MLVMAPVKQRWSGSAAEQAAATINISLHSSPEAGAAINGNPSCDCVCSRRSVNAKCLRIRMLV